jgi:nucleotide-binding universal stress UspA family protein
MNTIVVGTDGSTGAEAAVERIVELLRGKDVTVHVVCAIPARSALERIGVSARQDPVDLRGVAADVLARAERRLVEAGLTVDKQVREGDPAHVILDVAEDQHADLIVVGARGNTGLRRFMLGNVAGKLSHHAATSLLIVRQD